MTIACGVAVLGSVNTDLVIRNVRLPVAGETILGGEFYRALGGKGANQAVAAARAARVPVAFVAALGDDTLGREALEALRRENLDLRCVQMIRGQASGVALILVDHAGQNLISVASGANSRLCSQHFDQISDAELGGMRVFLASLETPVATVAHGLARARRAGLTTILNPAPANCEILAGELLKTVDVLTPNESEIAILAGAEPLPFDGDTSRIERWALELQERGCGAVVVTLGAEGCLVVADTITRVAAHRVEAVDATAAGDAFSGALAAALAEGLPLLDGVRFASAAAALSVTRRGAQPSLPARSEIEDFLSRPLPPPEFTPRNTA
ncbi:MAG: ribokinase [Planctomycetaceae bacterium]|nr:MAG: ribokinase [Planctomycetaceae bacterium]